MYLTLPLIVLLTVSIVQLRIAPSVVITDLQLPGQLAWAFERALSLPGMASRFPYLTEDDSEDFVALADLVLHVPAAGAEGPCHSGTHRSAAAAQLAAEEQLGGGPHDTEDLPLHSQVLSRVCRTVAGMLCSLGESGPLPSPRTPLDISPLFQGASRPAILLFLRCAYHQEVVREELGAAAAAAGVDARNTWLSHLLGMIRLAHRLHAPLLLRSTLAWAHSQRDCLTYAINPGAWLCLGEQLHHRELLAEVACWVLARLAAGPDAAAPVLQARLLPAVSPCHTLFAFSITLLCYVRCLSPFTRCPALAEPDFGCTAH